MKAASSRVTPISAYNGEWRKLSSATPCTRRKPWCVQRQNCSCLPMGCGAHRTSARARAPFPSLPFPPPPRFRLQQAMATAASAASAPPCRSSRPIRPCLALRLDYSPCSQRFVLPTKSCFSTSASFNISRICSPEFAPWDSGAVLRECVPCGAVEAVRLLCLISAFSCISHVLVRTWFGCLVAASAVEVTAFYSAVRFCPVDWEQCVFSGLSP